MKLTDPFVEKTASNVIESPSESEQFGKEQTQVSPTSTESKVVEGVLKTGGWFDNTAVKEAQAHVGIMLHTSTVKEQVPIQLGEVNAIVQVPLAQEIKDGLPDTTLVVRGRVPGSLYVKVAGDEIFTW